MKKKAKQKTRAEKSGISSEYNTGCYVVDAVVSIIFVEANKDVKICINILKKSASQRKKIRCLSNIQDMIKQ